MGFNLYVKIRKEQNETIKNYLKGRFAVERQTSSRQLQRHYVPTKRQIKEQKEAEEKQMLKEVKSVIRENDPIRKRKLYKRKQLMIAAAITGIVIFALSRLIFSL